MVKPRSRSKTTSDSFSPQIDMMSVLGSVVGVIGGPLGAFIEAIFNSEDANATEIKVAINNFGKADAYEVIFLDNGTGMGPAGRDAFMNLGMSLRRSQSMKRGRHGLGAKRTMFDFTWCEVYDISREDPSDQMCTWTFKVEDYLRRLSGDEKVELPLRMILRDPTLIGLSEGSTGVRIRLWGARGRMYAPDTVRKYVPRHLNPWLIDKVSINGERLGQREIIGEAICDEVENDPQLGRILFRLYIPQDRTDTDTLQVGAFEPLATWQEFYEILQSHHPALAKHCPDIFAKYPQICGTILVTGFASGRSGFSKSFEPDFFSREVKKITAFLQWLDFTLVPRIHDVMGIIEEKDTSAQSQRLIEDVSQLLSLLGVHKKDPVPPQPKRLELTVKTAELLPGEEIKIRVRRSATDIRTITWNCPKGGGRIRKDTPDGREITYTAPSIPGTVHKLIACGDDQESTTAEVVIDVVPQRVLRIHPPSLTVEPGEEIRLKAINWMDFTPDEKKLVWLKDPDDKDGKFISSHRGEVVRYQVGSREGQYKIELFLDKNRTVTAASWVTVMRGAPPTTRPGKGDVAEGVQIEGIAYRLVPMPSPTTMELSWLGPTKGDLAEIYINTDHPLLREVKGGHFARIQLLLGRTLLHHLEHRVLQTGETLSPREISIETGRLHHEIHNLMRENERRKS